MAKKDNENFDFDTEAKAKPSFDLSFLKNLTQKQKETILMIAIIIVAVIVIVTVGVIMLGNSGGDNNNNGDSSNSGNISGDGNEENNDNIAEELTSFDISAPPTKTVYFVGDELDCTGLRLHYRDANHDSHYVYYTDDPDSFEITGFDSSAPAERQVITVTCQGFSDTFIVEIKAIQSGTPKLVSIHFSTYPQQIYSVDDTFNYLGGVLTCTYSDGSTKDIELMPEYMYGVGNIFDSTGEHILLPGEHVIEIEYYEDGVFVQTEYVITVN